jgi:hypothetical protein
VNVTVTNNVVAGSIAHNVSFAAQNVRSLNISTKNEITCQKILAITKKCCDVIFLSDLRLNSSLQKSAVHDIEKKFLLQGYKLFHNSVSSIRGVGIHTSSQKYS